MDTTTRKASGSWGEDEHESIPLNEEFLSHANFPRNMGAMAEPSGSATGKGICGDTITINLKIDRNRIIAVRCQPMGCIFTLTCASALSELAQGRTLEQALELNPEDVERELGGLPEDHRHCARLAVNTLGEAIDDFYLKSRVGR